MPIYVISTIEQKNAAIFPLLEDVNLKGGFQTAASVAARNLIPATYRKVGMFVWTELEAKLWRLDAGLVTWTEFTGGSGGSGNALEDVGSANATFAAGTPVTLNPAGTLDAADADNAFEVYGFSVGPGAVGAPVTVVTHGVITNALWALTVGSIYYLAVGGGITTVAPNLDLAAPGVRSIVRVGQARTATSLLVRIQHIAVS